jgi:hypothetical protein
VRVQVLMAASTKIRVFGDISPLSLIEVDRHFRDASSSIIRASKMIALMLKAVNTSEKSVNFYKNARGSTSRTVIFS